jgi:hypothetical protein
MTNRFRTRLKLLSAGICSVLVANLMAPVAPAQALPAQLNIVNVKGDGAVNDARQHADTTPTVRIEDEHQKPVVDAVVVFTLPTEGATGEFAKHSKTLTVMTDSEGLAMAKGLHLNQVPGKVPIHINASYRGLTARGGMTQSNVVRDGAKAGHGGKIAVILLLLGAAAGGGAYAALRKTAPSTTPSTPVSTALGVTPGTGTVGAPH